MKTRWQVKWCSRMRFDDCGDMMPDLAEYTIRNFPNKGLAAAFAVKITPDDYFACVRIHEQEYGLEFDYSEVKDWYTIDTYEIDVDDKFLYKIT